MKHVFTFFAAAILLTACSQEFDEAHLLDTAHASRSYIAPTDSTSAAGQYCPGGAACPTDNCPVHSGNHHSNTHSGHNPGGHHGK